MASIKSASEPIKPEDKTLSHLNSYQPSDGRSNHHPLLENTQERKAALSAQQYLNLGNEQYHQYLTVGQKNALVKAIGHYRSALEINPNLPEAYVKLASALWNTGEINLETAKDYCEVALKLNPNNADPHFYLGKFFRQSNQLDNAIYQFKQAIEKAPLKSSRARIALGATAVQKANQSQKSSLFHRLSLTFKGLLQVSHGCVLLPFDQQAFQTFADSFLVDVKIYGTLGLGTCLQRVGLTNLTIRLYDAVSKYTPTEPLFFHHLGDLNRDKGAFDASIYYYNRSLELDAENVSLLKKLGKAYLSCNDIDNAILCLEKTVPHLEGDFEVFYNLGIAYTQRNECIRALYYLKESANLDPSNPYIHSNMGYILFKLEDYEGAIQEYQKAVTYGEDPVWTSTVAQTLGTIYAQISQDTEAAIDMFQTAYRLNPKNMDCMAMLGELYFNQGHYESAIKVYRDILTQEPENPDCFTYLGYLLWQIDRNEEAIDAYTAALKFDPNNSIAYNNLAVIYLDDMKNTQAALKFFEKALEANPKYTLACFNVGRAHEDLGNITEAAKVYSKALELNAENPELDDNEIMERMQRLFDVDR